MAATVTKLPIRKETAGTPAAWRPFEGFRRDMNRLLDEFGFGAMSPGRNRMFEPFWQEAPFGGSPAVDVTEQEDAYEVTAELPGMDEKQIEVKVSDGVLTITGEKKEEHEEKKQGYYLAERRYGSFQRAFALPEGVKAEEVTAAFAKGVLTVRLPKSPEAKKAEKKVDVVAR